MIYDNTFFLGIRHHGPGSAQSLLRALEEIRPDLLVIEGPPEAESVLSWVDHAAVKPPVALLIYAPADLALSALFPLVKFSPEWQALRFARRQQLPIRLMDLPQCHHLALHKAAQTALQQLAPAPETGAAPNAPATPPPYLPPEEPPADPLTLLAEAAGFGDGEAWWEFMVEERQEGLAVFTGIGEAMQAVRQAVEGAAKLENAGAAMLPDREALREAWMRNTLRQAKAEGLQRIAVVCGAWHVPALAVDLAEGARRQQDELICRDLPACPVTATWVPWSYERISRASGYGAGVSAPGWYQFLWESRQQRQGRRHYVAAAWLSKVARLLRKEGIDVAAASVIEAVRLAETLAALRDKPQPDRTELQEAALAVLCNGNAEQLALIENRLVIGSSLGRVPDETPQTPLQIDLAQTQRRLRLLPDGEVKALELDLRNATDLARSQLLHRLNLLGIAWGELARPAARSKGTFKEAWRLQWQPEFVVRLIELSVWGGSLSEAAIGFAQHQLQTSTELVRVVEQIDQALLADLPPVVEAAVRRLNDLSAVVGDVVQLMTALPPLARLLRYGNVRLAAAPANPDPQLPADPPAALQHLVSSFVTRIAVGLPAACYALDDASALTMLHQLEACHAAVQLVQEVEYTAIWEGALIRVAGLADLHGYVAGKCCRLLLAAHKLTAADITQRLHFALSTASDPAAGAAWLEGLLRGSGLLLVHDADLWGVIDDWLCQLSATAFVQVLPLLRRTFATFPVGERRMIGDKVKQGSSRSSAGSPAQPAELDWATALLALPLLQTILGPAREAK